MEMGKIDNVRICNRKTYNTVERNPIKEENSTPSLHRSEEKSSAREGQIHRGHYDTFGLEYNPKFTFNYCGQNITTGIVVYTREMYTDLCNRKVYNQNGTLLNLKWNGTLRLHSGVRSFQINQYVRCICVQSACIQLSI